MIQDLIQRYYTLMKSGVPHNPYYESRFEWVSEINKKIEELKKVEEKEKFG